MKQAIAVCLTSLLTAATAAMAAPVTPPKVVPVKMPKPAAPPPPEPTPQPGAETAPAAPAVPKVIPVSPPQKEAPPQVRISKPGNPAVGGGKSKTAQPAPAPVKPVVPQGGLPEFRDESAPLINGVPRQFVEKSGMRQSGAASGGSGVAGEAAQLGLADALYSREQWDMAAAE